MKSFIPLLSSILLNDFLIFDIYDVQTKDELSLNENKSSFYFKIIVKTIENVASRVTCKE